MKSAFVLVSLLAALVSADGHLKAEAATAASDPQYGSGFAPKDMDECMSFCKSKFNPLAGGASAAPKPDTGAAGNDLSALVKVENNRTVAIQDRVVVVAPAQGVLRFVPFAMQAKVGEKVTYVWGGSNHTVTQASGLLPCNRSLSESAFKPSGPQNKSFVFDVEVKDDKPMWIFCAVGQHCLNGMFQVINPAVAKVEKDNAKTWIQNNVEKHPNLATALDTATKDCAGKAETCSYGDNWSMADDAIPKEHKLNFALNLLDTRSALALDSSAVAAAVSDQPARADTQTDSAASQAVASQAAASARPTVDNATSGSVRQLPAVPSLLGLCALGLVLFS